MPAGHDDGSPAKKYADDYRKAREEIVMEIRKQIAFSWPWPDRIVELMNRYNINLTNLYLGGI